MKFNEDYESKEIASNTNNHIENNTNNTNNHIEKKEGNTDFCINCHKETEKARKDEIYKDMIYEGIDVE